MDCKENNSENLNSNPEEKIQITSNIEADELDEETLRKLRGDTIGDTLYSKSFVLKTLLQFSDLKWDERVEEDLCFLWDMTVENDVCKFLLEISYPSLACNAVLNYRDNNRFIEIVIGILGNLFCSSCENSMSTDEISMILSTIGSDDHLILIQLMRFISMSLETNKSLLLLIDAEFIDTICFILENSINYDLLLKTLECVSKLTVDFRLNEDLVGFSLYKSVLVSYQTLTKSESEYFEPDTKEKLSLIKYLLEIVTNICSYIVRFEKNILLLEINRCSNMFTYEIIKILNYFSQEANLLPVTDEIIFFLSAIRYIFINLKLNYIPEIFLSVSKILDVIIDIKDELEEFYEPVLELECYLISCTQYDSVKKDLRSLSEQKLKKILKVVNKNCKKYGFNLNKSYNQEVI